MDRSVPINAHIQRQLRSRNLAEVRLPRAARWLDVVGLLPYGMKSGGPLRRLARIGAIGGAYQDPDRRYGRWFVRQIQ